MSNLKYSNGLYEVKFTQLKARPYKVQRISDHRRHTHVRSLKEAIDLANYAKYGDFPQSASEDYTISFTRLIDQGRCKSKCSRKLRAPTYYRGGYHGY